MVKRLNNPNNKLHRSHRQNPLPKDGTSRKLINNRRSNSLQFRTKNGAGNSKPSNNQLNSRQHQTLSCLHLLRKIHSFLLHLPKRKLSVWEWEWEWARNQKRKRKRRRKTISPKDLPKSMLMSTDDL